MRHTPYGATHSGEMPTDRMFTGQRHETSLGLYDYNARYYDPAIGRFVSADTIVPQPGNPQSLNRYAYCLGNPLRHADPTGHLTDDQIKKYTEYNTPEKFEDLQRNSELYWMLRALHLDDWLDVGDGGYYKAQLVDGDLFFVGDSNESVVHTANDFIGVGYFMIERQIPGYRHGEEWSVLAYMWYRGDNPETSYLNRWMSIDAYRSVTGWEHIRDFQLENALGTGLIFAGVGMLVPEPTPLSEALFFVAGVAFDLVVEAAELVSTPAGVGQGDEIYTYTYEDWVETVTIRGGKVIAHDWTPR